MIFAFVLFPRHHKITYHEFAYPTGINVCDKSNLKKRRKNQWINSLPHVYTENNSNTALVYAW